MKNMENNLLIDTIHRIIDEIIIGQCKLQEKTMTKEIANEYLCLCKMEEDFKNMLKRYSKKEEGKEEEKCQQV